MAIITLNNNSLSSVTSLPAAISTGKVLQVVQTASGSTNMISTSGYVGSGLSITPSSSSNKIQIIMGGRAEQYAGDANDYTAIKLVRGTTDLYTMTDAHSYKSTGERIQFNINYLDSPNTTSSTQYRIYSTDNGGSSVSYYQWWTLLEIKG